MDLEDTEKKPGKKTAKKATKKEKEPEIMAESTVDSTPDTLVESTSGTAELEMVQATEDLDSDDDLESLEE